MINLYDLAAIVLPVWAGPATVVVGGVIIVGLVIGIIYYRHQANQVLEFGPNDYCHVKYNPADGKFTVTCEGVCKTGQCDLYSRPKGTDKKWTPTEKDMPEDPAKEYRCFCHNPNRP